MKLATSTGDFIRYSYSIAEAVRSFADTKFRYLNLELDNGCEETDMEPEKAAALLQQAAEEAGITYSTAHAPCLDAFDGDRDHYDHCIRSIRNAIGISGRLGIKGIVVHASGSTAFTRDEYFRRNMAFYSEFFDLMEKYGITVMTENMANSSVSWLSAGKDVRELADYVDHPLFGVCWDTAHANLNAAARPIGQYDNILAVGDKLKGLHIADNFGDGPHHHTFPFAGIINFDSVMQALLDVDYGGYFTFEASYTLLHHTNLPYHRQSWEHDGQTVSRLLDPPITLKQEAVDLMYDIGAYILKTYDCFEEQSDALHQ